MEALGDPIQEVLAAEEAAYERKTKPGMALTRAEKRTVHMFNQQLRGGLVGGLEVLAVAYPHLVEKSLAIALKELAWNAEEHEGGPVPMPMTMKLLDMLPRLVGPLALQDGDNEAFNALKERLRRVDEVTRTVTVTERVIRDPV